MKEQEQKTELTRGEELYAIAATLSLGRTGLGTNDKLALKYLEDAAKEGCVPAIVRLASWYDEGTGVERNGAKAEELYRRAIAAGDKSALSSLFLMMRGEGRLVDGISLLLTNGVEEGAAPYAGFFAEHAFFVLHDFGRAYRFALTMLKFGSRSTSAILAYCLALGAGASQDLDLAECFLCEAYRDDYFADGWDPLFELAKAVVALPAEKRSDRLMAIALHGVLFSEVTCIKGAKEFRRKNFPAGSDKLLDPFMVALLVDRNKRSVEEADAGERVKVAVEELKTVPDPVV